MKNFLDENFLLNNKTGQQLYFDYAEEMPIIDYHCHLPPQQVAANHCFQNITQAWLYGDHYKWRAMRTNGIPESYCTGNKSDYEKFEKWAQTVPYTLRNPLYHWTHLELQRYFDVHEILDGRSAKKIYENCSAKLQSEDYSTRNLLRKMKVNLVCTTDDPTDSLKYHQQLKNEGFEIFILPAFRADKAMQPEDIEAYNQYLQKLEAAADETISTYGDFLFALKKRHDFFASQGCNVSDHGLEQIFTVDFTLKEIDLIFNKARNKKTLSPDEILKFKSAVLLQLAEWDWEKGWIQQFHLGALRNNNSRLLKTLGPDTGWDSMGDFSQAKSISKFFDILDKQDKLAKTILYNVNPADNELMATVVGNFNDGSTPGKIQWGAAWWFLDQKDGMTRHLNALSNMSLITRFVGMITDSRSFLSFPRHEYFRRLLCNIFGEEMENGELPNDIAWMGKVIKDICYYNAQHYFNWEFLEQKETAVREY